MKRFTNLLFILFILSSCSNDSENETMVIDTASSVALINQAYGANSDQQYDIYLPANRNLNTKVILLIHGGGWSAGDKNDMNGFKDYFLQEFPEVAVVNMNYRLADATASPYPMQLDDITLLTKDLETKQSEYQIGTELGILGTSAGGHLALLWSYSRDIKEQILFVCSIVGPTNLLDNAYQNTENLILRGLIDLFGDDPLVLEKASPLYQAKSTSPPTQLFYGGQDPLVPISQGIDLDVKLSVLGVEHEFTLYENAGHGWIGEPLLDTSIKLKNFMTKNLK